jgi:hypothetical protein
MFKLASLLIMIFDYYIVLLWAVFHTFRMYMLPLASGYKCNSDGKTREAMTASGKIGDRGL